MTEFIDTPGIPFSDWETCLKELNIINTFLGGHNITIEGVRQLFPPQKRAVHIAEIGCGGGDNLKAIHYWNKNNACSISYTGVDMNSACIDFAHKHCSELTRARFICADYREVDFGNHRPDIIFSSLFCHHFTDDQLVEMLVWLMQNATVGFFINDLHRHPLAFYSIKWLTRLFSKSYLVKNDAPISVLRGFKKSEWLRLSHRAEIRNFSIQWKWAFRHLIVVKNEY